MERRRRTEVKTERVTRSSLTDTVDMKRNVMLEYIYTYMSNVCMYVDIYISQYRVYIMNSMVMQFHEIFFIYYIFLYIYFNPFFTFTKNEYV